MHIALIIVCKFYDCIRCIITYQRKTNSWEIAIIIAHCHGNSWVLKVITVPAFGCYWLQFFRAAVAPPGRGELFR